MNLRTILRAVETWLARVSAKHWSSRCRLLLAFLAGMMAMWLTIENADAVRALPAVLAGAVYLAWPLYTLPAVRRRGESVNGYAERVLYEHGITLRMTSSRVVVDGRTVQVEAASESLAADALIDSSRFRR